MAKRRIRKALSSEEATKKLELWNVFEWDKPEQYEYVKLLKGDRLRWEFLRRDDDYRTDYEKYHAKRQHPILGKYIPPQKRGDELPENFCFLDTLRRGEPLVLPPPSIKNMLFTKEEGTADHKISQHYGYQLEQLQELGFVVMVFDPARKPSSQIIGARKYLNESYSEFQKSCPNHTIGNKRNPREAIKLLRALDAAFIGVQNHTISEKIFPNKKWDIKDRAAEDKYHENKVSTGQERVTSAAKYWRTM